MSHQIPLNPAKSHLKTRILMVIFALLSGYFCFAAVSRVTGKRNRAAEKAQNPELSGLFHSGYFALEY
ncbi:hypothetical protein [Vibrio owensii]|uniref:hypothetical protein n=1 Tax=Vibrio owensii TaxID=696485 RepID=UPI0019D131BB|nr:hypothetical protein [Vibrio owensii]